MIQPNIIVIPFVRPRIRRIKKKKKKTQNRTFFRVPFFLTFLPQSPPPWHNVVHRRRVCCILYPHEGCFVVIPYTPHRAACTVVVYNIEYTTDLSVCGLGKKNELNKKPLNPFPVRVGLYNNNNIIHRCTIRAVVYYNNIMILISTIILYKGDWPSGGRVLFSRFVFIILLIRQINRRT